MNTYKGRLLQTTVLPAMLGVGLALGGMAGAAALTTTPAFAACGPKNPCAAKANPCAAKPNPCAAKANPCAAKPNPCAAKANPCAAKPNPCAAKKK